MKQVNKLLSAIFPGLSNEQTALIFVGVAILLVVVIVAIVMSVKKNKTNKTIEEISVDSTNENIHQEEIMTNQTALETNQENSDADTKLEPTTDTTNLTKTKKGKSSTTKSTNSKVKNVDKQEKPAEEKQKETKAETTSVEEPEIVAKSETDADTQTEDKTNEVKVKNQKYMVLYDKENKDWVIKKTGASRASKRCKTKKEALEFVEKFAENQDLKVSVKKKDGKFQKTAKNKK